MNANVHHVSECISLCAPCGRCFIATTVIPWLRPSRQYIATRSLILGLNDSTYAISSNAMTLLLSGCHSCASNSYTLDSWNALRCVPIRLVCGQNTQTLYLRTSLTFRTIGQPSFANTWSDRFVTIRTM